VSGRHAIWTPEARARQSAKASETLRGRPVSAATRARIAAAQADERAHNWRGDEVGYTGVHKRAYKVLPERCELADKTCRGQLEVALRPDAAGPFREDPRGPYSPRVEDYRRLCRSHHNREHGKAPPPETRIGRGHRS
jgi:hypothetical protein